MKIFQLNYFLLVLWNYFLFQFLGLAHGKFFKESSVDHAAQVEQQIIPEEHFAVHDVRNNLNYILHQQRENEMEAKAEIMAQSITTQATLTPMFQMALLSLDGRYCTITFSTQTNKAGIAYNFPCTTFLQFPGDSKAFCYWQDAATIIIYPDLTTPQAIAQAIGVGSVIVVKPNNNIKAICPAENSGCVSGAVPPFQSHLVEPPITPATPNIVFASPSIITGCSSWAVDLTATSGDGGRGFQGKIFISGSNADGTPANVGLFNTYFKSNYTLAKPFTIPSRVFTVGATYHVDLELCNFFLKCNWGNFTLTISTENSVPPVVVVAGASYRNFYTTAALSVTATAYTTTCAGGQDFSGMSYDWIFVNMTGAPSVMPGNWKFSKTPSVFLLPSYSVQVPGPYMVRLTVTDSKTTKQTIVDTYLNLLYSPLVASIAPSTMQLVKFGSSMTLDGGGVNGVTGTNSFDPNAILDGLTGMRFFWRCSQIAPVVSANCPLTLTNVTSVGGSKKLVVPQESAVNGTYAVRMTVFKGNRNASTTVNVRVIDGNAPSITFTTPVSAVTNVNPSSRITITAQIKSDFACSATWSSGSLDLEKVSATTPVKPVLIPAKLSTTVNFYVLANSLLPQSTSAFSISCSRSTAVITVTTNGPPIGGTFKVDPKEGLELSTPFDFSATQWSDTDLPITYSFGFVSPTTALFSSIQSRSEIARVTSNLPGGPNGLKAIVAVFDSLSCSVLKNFTVVVKPLSSSAAQAAILAQLNSTSGSSSIDAIKQVISVASASLSQVNCTGTTISYCNGLNRNPCGTTSHTCGACLTGMVGVAGDSNSKCFSPAQFLNSTVVAATCTSDDQCPSLFDCKSAKCVPQQQKCPADCNGHGGCFYQDLNSPTGATIATCSVFSSTCVPFCKCNTGYQGDTCSLTAGELGQAQKIRYLLLDGLDHLMKNEDATNETISSTVSSITSLVQSAFDLNNKSLPIFQSIAQAAVATAAADSSIDLASIQGLLASSDISINAQNTLTTDTKSTDAFNFLNNLITNYISVLQRQQLVDGGTTSAILSNFRTSSSSQSLIHGSNVAVTVPQTALERLANPHVSSVSASVSIDPNNPVSSASFAVTQYSSSMVAPSANSTVLSHVLQISFTAANNPLIVKIANIKKPVSENAVNFTYNCDGEGKFNYTCVGSDYPVTINCNGRKGQFTQDCPVRRPTCGLVNMTGIPSTKSGKDICTVINVTDSFITCSCLPNMTEIGYAYRRLDSTNQILYQTGVLNLIGMSEYTTEELVTTFNAAPHLATLEGVQKVLTVIIMFGVLWVGGLTIIFATVYKQQRQKAKHDERKTNLIRAVDRKPPKKGEMKDSLARYVRSVFPSVFYQDNWLMKLKEEILKNHIYLLLLTAPKGELEDKKRIISGVKLLTVQSCLMCLLAIFYDLQCPSDDGSCDKFLTKQNCLTRTSLLDSSQTYCKWVQYSPNIPDGTCQFNDLTVTFKTALYVQVIVSIFSLFVMKPLDIAFDILLAPTKRYLQLIKTKEAAMEKSHQSVFERTARRLSSIFQKGNAVAPINLQALQQQKLKRGTSVRQISDQVIRNHIIAQAILKSETFHLDPSIIIPTPEELASDYPYEKLVEMIFRQRESLQPEEIVEFDVQWGIESSNAIQDQDMRLHYRPVQYQIKDAVSEKIRKHIEIMKEDYESIKQKLDDPAMSRSNKGLEILYEFILDLLGRDTPAAKIFRAKSEEDFQQLGIVEIWQKVLAGGSIVVLNGFFVYYSLLRGYVRGEQWQHDYLVACLIQMIAEIFLFQTMECVWINFIVPNLVAKEVFRTNQILTQLIERVCHRIRHDPVQAHDVLNTADHLFASKRLAAWNPKLVESLLVFSYRNHLPGEIARKWLKKEELHAFSESTSETGSVKGGHGRHNIDNPQNAENHIENTHRTWKELSIVASFLVTLQVVGTFPFFIQKMIVRFVQPFFYGGMVNVFQLVFANTVYTVIFVVLLLLIVGYIMYQFMINKKKRNTNVMALGVAPVSTPDDQHALKRRVREDIEMMQQQQPLLAKSLHDEEKGDEDRDELEKKKNDKHHGHHRHHKKHHHTSGEESLDEGKSPDEESPAEGGKPHKKHHRHHKKHAHQNAADPSDTEGRESTEDEAAKKKAGKHHRHHKKGGHQSSDQEGKDSTTEGEGDLEQGTPKGHHGHRHHKKHHEVS
jgi:hypothetical protein